MEEEAANAASGHYHHFGKDVRAGEMSDGENEAVQSLGKWPFLRLSLYLSMSEISGQGVRYIAPT